MSSKPKILVVDDEEAIRELVRAVLERAEFEVTTAADGREAIALLTTSQYDVILLDVIMPNLNGLGVVDELRRNNEAPLAHTYLMTGAELTLSNLPVRGVISKPFDPAGLVAAARDCIGR